MAPRLRNRPALLDGPYVTITTEPEGPKFDPATVKAVPLVVAKPLADEAEVIAGAVYDSEVLAAPD